MVMVVDMSAAFKIEVFCVHRSSPPSFAMAKCGVCEDLLTVLDAGESTVPLPCGCVVHGLCAANIAMDQGVTISEMQCPMCLQSPKVAEQKSTGGRRLSRKTSTTSKDVGNDSATHRTTDVQPSATTTSEVQDGSGPEVTNTLIEISSQTTDTWEQAFGGNPTPLASPGTFSEFERQEIAKEEVAKESGAASSQDKPSLWQSALEQIRKQQGDQQLMESSCEELHNVDEEQAAALLLDAQEKLLEEEEAAEKKEAEAALLLVEELKKREQEATEEAAALQAKEAAERAKALEELQAKEAAERAKALEEQQAKEAAERAKALEEQRKAAEGARLAEEEAQTRAFLEQAKAAAEQKAQEEQEALERARLAEQEAQTRAFLEQELAERAKAAAEQKAQEEALQAEQEAAERAKAALQEALQRRKEKAKKAAAEKAEALRIASEQVAAAKAVLLQFEAAEKAAADEVGKLQEKEEVAEEQAPELQEKEEVAEEQAPNEEASESTTKVVGEQATSAPADVQSEADAKSQLEEDPTTTLVAVPGQSDGEQKNHTQEHATSAADVQEQQLVSPSPIACTTLARIKCIMCHLDAAAETAKLLGTKDARFKCAQCVRVDLAITRKVKSVQWLRDLADSKAIASFYQQAHALCPEAIKKLCQAQISIKKVNTDFYHESGEYLPLSVWENRGWKPEIIERESDPADVWETKKWGTLYRIPIVKTGTNNSTRVENSLELLAGSRKRALKRSLSDQSADLPPKIEDVSAAHRTTDVTHRTTDVSAGSSAAPAQPDLYEEKDEPKAKKAKRAKSSSR